MTARWTLGMLLLTMPLYAVAADHADETLRIKSKPRKAATEIDVPPAPVSAETIPAPAPTKAPREKNQRIPESDWPQALHRAHEAYDQGDYQRALTLYEGLIESGLVNGHVSYNLANSLVRSGQLGRGLAAYMHSARLLPRDQDVQANLAYARKSTKDAIEPVQPSPLSRTLFFWHHKLSMKEALLAAGLTSLLFWIGMIIRLFRRESELLRWAVVGLFILLLAFGGSLIVRLAWPLEVAVVTTSEVKVRSGTARDATVLFKLHEGTEVELIGDSEGWLKIRLPDGKRGWLMAAGVEVVARRL